MVRRVDFAPEARDQLLAIYRFISDHANAEVALTFTSALADYCESFATFPHRGTARDDLRPGLRTIGFRRRATIAFRVEDDAVLILGIFYRGQDVDTALGEEEL